MSKRDQEQFRVRMLRDTHKDAARATGKQDAKTKKRRAAELAGASELCGSERKAARKEVSARCRSRRGQIRSEANARLSKTKGRRATTRTAWVEESRRYRGDLRLKRGQRRYSRSESDSIALHNVELQYAEFFLLTRQDWSYDKQPDARAEEFNEYVATDEGHNAWVELEDAKVPSDAQFSKAYARHAAEYQEAAPF